jgi:hypothetical protein
LSGEIASVAERVVAHYWQFCGVRQIGPESFLAGRDAASLQAAGVRRRLRITLGFEWRAGQRRLPLLSHFES